MPRSRSVLKPLRRWDPERIGPYVLLGKLGGGAMGQVFLARSTAGRLVAVKTIRVELAEEPGFRSRFAREVAAARRVSGVFTAAVIEADAEADLPWVATAYVPAPSLSALVRECGPLPVPAVRWLAAGCAEALQSIHGAGLLHRDVKPSNVLVAPDGPRVIDFGVARATERIELTAARGSAGTPAYMAPEQARDARAASPASDVFSLGATLVFAATGHPPYQGDTVTDILVRLATEPPDLSGLPAELTSLVTGCLERVPRDRPSDAAILEGLGSFALPAGPGHSYLPESAMALIAEYQHDLASVSLARIGSLDDTGDTDEDPASWPTDGSGASAAGGVSRSSGSTSGSHTALPGFEQPDAFHLEPGRPERSASQKPGASQEPGPGRPPGPARRRERRLALTPLVWAGVAVAAMVLLAVGAGVGIALDGPGMPQGPPPAITCSSASANGTPQVCVSQPTGDIDTVFVIHGSGFPPFTPVTVSLAGVGTSRYHPVADMQGTFNYAIDQGHYFWSGQIPPGTYTAVVTSSSGGRASASFQVHLPGGPPPGQGPPPGGGYPPP